jgi:hypothetical protein
MLKDHWGSDRWTLVSLTVKYGLLERISSWGEILIKKVGHCAPMISRRVRHQIPIVLQVVHCLVPIPKQHSGLTAARIS